MTNVQRVAASIFVLMAMTSPASATFRERTVSYRGYAYGSAGNYCSCQVGPCGFDDLLGQKTFYCDGTTSSWGITEGCFTRIITTFGETCYEGAQDNGTASLPELDIDPDASAD
jgi:hypothetical protein